MRGRRSWGGGVGVGRGWLSRFGFWWKGSGLKRRLDRTVCGLGGVVVDGVRCVVGCARNRTALGGSAWAWG